MFDFTEDRNLDLADVSDALGLDDLDLSDVEELDLELLV